MKLKESRLIDCEGGGQGGSSPWARLPSFGYNLTSAVIDGVTTKVTRLGARSR